MAVQNARISPADVRHLSAPPALRQARRSHSVAVLPTRRSGHARSPVGPSRPPTQAVRAVTAHTPWPEVELRFRSRLRPAAFVLAVIIVGTMLGLAYLTQTHAANSARYAVDRLLVDREVLLRQLNSQQVTVAEWGSEARVIQWAQHEGLVRLGDPVRVRSR